jgi:hypothetical protein
MTFFELIQSRTSGILLFGITPPKKSTPAEKVYEITKRTVDRIHSLPLDGLVLYDIQDEQSRTAAERPFPFLETIDSYEYANAMLSEISIPKIIYRATGKYQREMFSTWLSEVDSSRYAAVFVGSPSATATGLMNLSDAYDMRNAKNKSLALGGVLIPERHEVKRTEHIRMIEKQSKGCSFFISQCVYNTENAKNLLSDYYYRSQEEGIDPATIIFTLTTCGSMQTLRFMKWLGIQIPRWLENELNHTKDILSTSVELCKSIAVELSFFCRDHKIPYGINVESVSIRKEEIEASIELAKDIRKIL